MYQFIIAKTSQAEAVFELHSQKRQIEAKGEEKRRVIIFSQTQVQGVV